MLDLPSKKFNPKKVELGRTAGKISGDNILSVTQMAAYRV